MSRDFMTPLELLEGVVDGTIEGSSSAVEQLLDECCTPAVIPTPGTRARARRAIVQLCIRDSCGENGHCTALTTCALRPPLDEVARRPDEVTP